MRAYLDRILERDRRRSVGELKEVAEGDEEVVTFQLSARPDLLRDTDVAWNE